MSGDEGGCVGRVMRRTARSRMIGKYLPIFSLLFQQPLQRTEHHGTGEGRRGFGGDKGGCGK